MQGVNESRRRARAFEKTVKDLLLSGRIPEQCIIRGRGQRTDQHACEEGDAQAPSFNVSFDSFLTAWNSNQCSVKGSG